MASQSTLDKHFALQKKLKAEQQLLLDLQDVPNPTSADQRQIRVLKNSIDNIKYQYRTDKDLVGLANENMSPNDKLFLLGAAASTLPGPAGAGIINTALSVKQTQNLKNTTSPVNEVIPMPLNSMLAEDQSMVTSLKPTGQPKKIKPVRTNPLHSYPSYTYGLSLHLMTQDGYNNMVNNGEYTPSNVLIASAGKYTTDKSLSNNFARDPAFNLDFYFENLDITTIIGANERTRSTNAIDVKFTLVEPYGLTLLDRLLRASKDQGVPNYLQNPYMLQIDFYATDDEGNVLQPIPNLTKNIPIKILACNASVSLRGSEYQIQAIPFNHQAFDDLVVQTPINLEVSAKTVEGFFKESYDVGNEQLYQQMVKNDQRRNIEAETIRRSDLAGVLNRQLANLSPYTQQRLNQGTSAVPLLATTGGGLGTYSTEDGGFKYSQDEVYKTSSYGDAINAHVRRIATRASKERKFHDKYSFKFDERIGSATIIDGRPSPKDAPLFNTADLVLAKRSDNGYNVQSIGSDHTVTSINYGTSIEAVIGRVVRNSSYIRDQLAIRENYTDAEAYKAQVEKLKNQPLNWFKIIPSITLTGFDSTTNTFARLITYYVIPYTIKNVKLAEAPQVKANKADASKYYQYIYTGKNNDILDLNINFNAAYYTAITSYRSNNLYISGSEEYVDYDSTVSVSNTPVINSDSIQQTQIRYRTIDKRYDSSIKSKTASEVAAADLEKSLNTDAAADMIQVDLKILGDPDFVKQDDLFYSPTVDANGKILLPEITPDMSIATDNGEIYVDLTIKTPVDINDNTGLMDFQSGFLTSGFTGIYRVMQVSNIFDRGQFTQTLTLLRQSNQDNNTSAMSDNRSEQSTKDNALASPMNIPQTPDAKLNKKLATVEDTNLNVSKPTPETVPALSINTDQPVLAQILKNKTTVPISSQLELAPTSNTATNNQ